MSEYLTMLFLVCFFLLFDRSRFFRFSHFVRSKWRLKQLLFVVH